VNEVLVSKCFKCDEVRRYVEERGLSRAAVCRAIRRGELVSARVGESTVVTLEDLEAWVQAGRSA